jgi:hypothetical protein
VKLFLVWLLSDVVFVVVVVFVVNGKIIVSIDIELISCA